MTSAFLHSHLETSAVTDNLRAEAHFFILGAPKCGTTSFAHLLGQHPAIALSRPKETGFFDNDELYCLGLEYYARQFFAHRTPADLTGDATPSYLAGEDSTIRRVAEFYGGARPRFIILARDPVDRAWSHYLHLRRLMVEQRSFVQAVEEDLAAPFAHQRYLKHSMYGTNLERWLESFGSAEYFLVDTVDTLRDAEEELLRKADRFLDVGERPFKPPSARLNQATMPRYPRLMRGLNRDSALRRLVQRCLPPMARRKLVMSLQQAMLRTPEEADLPALDPSTRKELAGYFAKDLDLFSSLSGCDVSRWPSSS